MKIQEIFDLMKKHFDEAVIELVQPEAGDPYITCDAKKIYDISLFLRDHNKLEFDYLTMLTGLDLVTEMGVIYHLYSMKYGHTLTIRTIIPKHTPEIQTVERVWRAADWHEREAYDMFGIIFKGHHNLIRILCPYDWEGFPLRKDYVAPQEYHGMKVPY